MDIITTKNEKKMNRQDFKWHSIAEKILANPKCKDHVNQNFNTLSSRWDFNRKNFIGTNRPRGHMTLQILQWTHK